MRNLTVACCLAAIVSLLAVPLPVYADDDWQVAYDFVEALSSSGVINRAHATAESVSIRQQVRQGIFEHPDAPGKPLVNVTFPSVTLPIPAPNEKLVLRFWIGIREGFSFQDHPEADGVGFIIRIADTQVYRNECRQQFWQEQRIDLTAYAGKTIPIMFLTDPLKTSAYDWAVWGDPVVLIVNRKPVPEPVPQNPILATRRLNSPSLISRVVNVSNSFSGATVTAVLDRDLDLPTLTSDFEKRFAGTLAAAPQIVVGEGSDESNHTLVRVLDRFGLARTQFLAFPPSVRGGVNVCAGHLGEATIAASPIAPSTGSEIRLFTRGGVLVRSITPDRSIWPPYSIAVGSFLPGSADQIAVVSALHVDKNPKLTLYSQTGKRIGTYPLPLGPPFGPLTITRSASASEDRILFTLKRQKRAYLMSLRTKKPTFFNLPEEGASYINTAGNIVQSTVNDPLSRLNVVNPVGKYDLLDVGESENRFWLQWYGADWPAQPDGKYVKKSVFRHLRTDGSSPAARNPDLAATPEGCINTESGSGLADLLARYDTDLPALWEPCFTHRWMKGVFQSWRNAVDPETKLPKYVSLTRNNHPVEYGEFNSIDFFSGTYAFGMPEIDNLYLSSLSAALKQIAPHFHSNPEHFAALEPNHEHEIAVEADGSVGDYNPRMIAGFYAYLLQRYGTLGAINKELGCSFTGYFDAPRNRRRGKWDAYTAENPFFAEWNAYNRYVVNRRVAQTYALALNAGFPPEIVKSHQIPDTYAIGNLSAFSAVTSRFTPIDWELNAGAGYGFTRYGVWYKAPHDALIDAHHAGFDSMSLGEYQALTPSTTDAVNQLKFIHDNGGVSVHCMMWPADFDKGYNASMDAAAKTLLRQDQPRLTVTGGVGQVRTAVINGHKVDIVCIGVGSDHNGLLKSIRPDGKMEGTVYVTPFHAHIAVSPVMIFYTPYSLSTDPMQQLDSGDQIELKLSLKADAGGKLKFSILSKSNVLPGLGQEIDLAPGVKSVRFALRAQLPYFNVSVSCHITNAQVLTADAVLEHEQTPKLSRRDLHAERHRGGITFDVMN